jgi:hypothetical protein
MNVLDRAKAHFDTKGIKRIEVPEWKDEQGNPTVLLSEPFTLDDQRKLVKFAQDDGIEFIARLVIMKAMNEDGSKAFDLSDKPTLMSKTDPAVIRRIADEISASSTVEEMSGN